MIFVGFVIINKGCKEIMINSMYMKYRKGNK